MLGLDGCERRGITWRRVPSRNSVLHFFDVLLIRCFEPDFCRLTYQWIKGQLSKEGAADLTKYRYALQHSRLPAVDAGQVTICLLQNGDYDCLRTACPCVISFRSSSTIVKTSAPVELGALRKADGAEGF